MGDLQGRGSGFDMNKIVGRVGAKHEHETSDREEHAQDR
jgi:hypothetical protein